jgi:hypothetical protein
MWVFHRSICHRLPFGEKLLVVCGKLLDHIVAKRLKCDEKEEVSCVN